MNEQAVDELINVLLEGYPEGKPFIGILKPRIMADKQLLDSIEQWAVKWYGGQK